MKGNKDSVRLLKVLYLRVPEEFRERVKYWAWRNRCSVSSYCMKAIRDQMHKDRNRFRRSRETGYQF